MSKEDILLSNSREAGEDKESAIVSVPPSLTITNVTTNSSILISPPVFKRSTSGNSTASRFLANPLHSPFFLHDNNTPTPVIVDKLLSVLPDNPIIINPFDEAFKKRCNNLTLVEAGDEDALHTPHLNIIPDPDKRLGGVTSTPKTPSPVQMSKKAVRSIAPLLTDRVPMPSSEPSSAQLLLRFPTGEAFHLSDMPVVLSKGEGRTPSVSTPQPVVKDLLKRAIQRKRPHSSSGGTGNDEDAGGSSPNAGTVSPLDEKRRDILERNRAAASRSRMRKRDEYHKICDEVKGLRRFSQALLTENELLKLECTKLKGLLERHLDCSVTRELDHRELIATEIQPKVITVSSAQSLVAGRLPSNVDPPPSSAASKLPVSKMALEGQS